MNNSDNLDQQNKHTNHTNQAGHKPKKISTLINFTPLTRKIIKQQAKRYHLTTSNYLERLVLVDLRSHKNTFEQYKILLEYLSKYFRKDLREVYQYRTKKSKKYNKKKKIKNINNK